MRAFAGYARCLGLAFANDSLIISIHGTGSSPNGRMKGMKAYQNSAQLEVRLSDWTVNDYDEFAETFDASMGNDFANIIFDPSRKLIEKILGCGARIRHLDIACGSGVFLVKLAKAIATESFGIDISKGQIRQAKFRARRENIHATFQVGDIRTAMFPKDCDLVTCNLDALNHLHDVRDWLRVFRKVRACLRRGGLFLFDVNTPRRLIYDWRCPEIIIKPNLCYMHGGLALKKSSKVVRRKLFMQVFSRVNGEFKRTSALVEQTAVPNPMLFQMLTTAGFVVVKLRRIKSVLRAKHIFMRNRSFVMAKA